MTGPTVKEAVGRALLKLGMEADAVEVDVLAEPRKGLFGGTKPAVVRVREKEAPPAMEEPPLPGAETAQGTVTETATGAPAPTETDRPDPHEEPEVTETDATATATTEEQELSPEQRLNQLDEEADLAADFVEGLLDILELPGDIEIEVDDSQAFVNVVDVGSGLLIGRRGATLDALQELVRAATQRQVERRSHVRIDIEGYRYRQLEKLKDRCREGIAQVRETGEPFRLEPMDAYERKVMHDLVARTGGVTSASEGVEPRRRVVVYVADDE